jgi:hypothetical protein
MAFKVKPFSIKYGFAKVPNEIAFAKGLTSYEKITWIQLQALCITDQPRCFHGGLKQVATLANAPYSTLSRGVVSLREKGYLVEKDDGTLCLEVPEESVVVTVEAPEQEIPQAEDFSIAEEIESQKKRKPSGITQDAAWKDLCKSWNQHKPESWMLLDGRINLPVFIAIETHSKRLSITRDKMAGFVGQVAKGCKADEWWSQKTGVKISHVFGFGQKIKDTKFRDVERLQKLGNQHIVKFSWDDDNSIIEWYKEVCPGLTVEHVERIEMETGQEAWRHSQDHRGNGTVYLYKTHGEKWISHWSHRLDKKYPKCNIRP